MERKKKERNKIVGYLNLLIIIQEGNVFKSANQVYLSKDS